MFTSTDSQLFPLPPAPSLHTRSNLEIETHKKRLQVFKKGYPEAPPPQTHLTVSIIYHTMLQYVGLRFPLLKSLEYFPFEALGLLWWVLINNWILQREIRWRRGGDCDANNQNSWGKSSFSTFSLPLHGARERCLKARREYYWSSWLLNWVILLNIFHIDCNFLYHQEET